MTGDWAGPLAAARQVRIVTARRSGAGVHEVPVWFALVDGDLAVIARSAAGDWVRNVRADPAVTVCHQRRRWAARARVVTEEDESRTLQRAWYQRYVGRYPNLGLVEWNPEATVVRVVPAPDLAASADG